MSFTGPRKPTPWPEKAMLFVSAFAFVAAVHALAGWWLNSGAAMLRTAAILAALGAVAAFGHVGTLWARACSLWAGAMSAMAAALFWSGPGTIWPIVLVVSAGISAGAIFGGAWVGAAVARRWT
jgi:hypothetical protein